MRSNSKSSQSNDELDGSKQKKVKEFVCPCGKSYGSYPAVYAHIKRKHEGIAPGQVIRPKSVRKRGRPFKSLSIMEPNDKQGHLYAYKKMEKNGQKQELPPKNYYPFQSYLKQHKPYAHQQHLLQKNYHQLKRGYPLLQPSHNRPYEYPPNDDFYNRGYPYPQNHYYRNYAQPSYGSEYYPPPPSQYSQYPQYRFDEYRQMMQRQQKPRGSYEGEPKNDPYQNMQNKYYGQQNNLDNKNQLLRAQNLNSQGVSGQMIQNKTILKEPTIADFNPEQYQYVSVMMPLGDDKYKEVKVLQKKKHFQAIQKSAYYPQHMMQIHQKIYNEQQHMIHSQSQIFQMMLPSISRQVVQVKIQKEDQMTLKMIEQQLEEKFVPIQNGIMNFLQPILLEDFSSIKPHNSGDKSSQQSPNSDSDKKKSSQQKDNMQQIPKQKQNKTIKQILNQPIFKSIYQQLKRNRNSQDQQNFIQTSFQTVLNEFLKYLDSFLQSEQYVQIKMFIVLFYEYLFDKAHILNNQPWPKAYQMAQYFTQFIQQYLPRRIVNDYRSLSKYFLFQSISYCGGVMMMWLSNWLAIKQYVSNKLSRGYVQSQFSRENKQNYNYQQNYNQYVSAMMKQVQQSKPKKKRITIQNNSTQKKAIHNGSSVQVNGSFQNESNGNNDKEQLNIGKVIKPNVGQIIKEDKIQEMPEIKQTKQINIKKNENNENVEQNN